MKQFADHTTIGLGGPPRQWVEPASRDDLVDALREAGDAAFVIGGGSNLLVADDGIDDVALKVATGGIAAREEGEKVMLTVEAGEDWASLVELAVEEGLAGIECLSGIPGTAGAAPVQNIGAYAQELSEVLTEVKAVDRLRGETVTITRADCGFGYRTSRFKRHSNRYVVLAVTLTLRRSRESMPIRYPALVERLGIAPGQRVPLETARDTVLEVRREKGMVLDPDDPDTRSAGSFFMNPALNSASFAALRERVRQRLGKEAAAEMLGRPEGVNRVRTPAAWLIERAGFSRGHGNPNGIAISGKHVLALTNRGAGTSLEAVRLAEEIAGRVQEEFGVVLDPEPVFAGHDWSLS